ncbi:MAG TPA: aspartate carbamoyltransferase [Elusimicrobia bacterium]|nr:aspartate carbamoyltransferase [Elusimicrobiota bacterium]
MLETCAQHPKMNPAAAPNPEWESFYRKDITEKLPTFSRDGRLCDCLFAQQFDRDLLDRLCRLADHMRDITKTRHGDDFLRGLLANKRAMLFFSQPSTRTFLSFMSACQILGIRVLEIRDLKTSSQVKGESIEDTIRTFAAYVDLIIMRHHTPGFVEKASWVLQTGHRPVSVINAGSGADQHPTQALLDIYTLNRYLPGGLDGKHLVMVGDLKRGRTVRSLSYLMKNYQGVRLTFVAPEAFRMEPDILAFLNRHQIPHRETDDLASTLKEADAVYMTRIQDEHDAGGESQRVDYSPFHIGTAQMAKLPKHAVLMHPLPRREEIHPDVDKDPRAVYWRQERNGMWIRTALIAYLFRMEKAVLGHHSEG